MLQPLHQTPYYDAEVLVQREKLEGGASFSSFKYQLVTKHSLCLNQKKNTVFTLTQITALVNHE